MASSGPAGDSLEFPTPEPDSAYAVKLSVSAKSSTRNGTLSDWSLKTPPHSVQPLYGGKS